MASPGNRHCANCIGTLSFPIQRAPTQRSWLWSTSSAAVEEFCWQYNQPAVHYVQSLGQSSREKNLILEIPEFPYNSVGQVELGSFHTCQNQLDP